MLHFIFVRFKAAARSFGLRVGVLGLLSGLSADKLSHFFFKIYFLLEINW